MRVTRVPWCHHGEERGMDFGRWFHLPWPLALLADLIYGVLLYAGLALLTVKIAFWQLKRQRHKLAGADLHEIDRLSGEQFEQFLEILFERLGYQTEVTGRYDQGADLILTREGIRTAVQAKCWKQPVGIEAVRAV